MNNTYNQKHLSLEDRRKIEEGIEKRLHKSEIAKSINKDFSSNIYFKEIISYDNNLVKPIIQGQHDENLELNLDINNHKEVTKIPTGGIRINDDIYIFYMSVRYWGKPGEWFVTENQLLKAKYYDLKNFKKVENVNFKCSDSEQFGQIYPFLNKDDKTNGYRPDILAKDSLGNDVYIEITNC